MTETDEDARMRALFGDAPAPPMGDEIFVRSVMERVEEVNETARGRRQAFAMAVTALAAMAFWPFRDAIGAGLAGALQRYLPNAIDLTAGGATLLMALAAGAAAFVYAERG